MLARAPRRAARKGRCGLRRVLAAGGHGDAERACPGRARSRPSRRRPCPRPGAGRWRGRGPCRPARGCAPCPRGRSARRCAAGARRRCRGRCPSTSRTAPPSGPAPARDLHPAAGRRVLDRVLHQVLEDAAQAVGVGHHRGRARRRVRASVDLLAPGEARERRHHVLGHLRRAAPPPSAAAARPTPGATARAGPPPARPCGRRGCGSCPGSAGRSPAPPPRRPPGPPRSRGSR